MILSALSNNLVLVEELSKVCYEARPLPKFSGYPETVPVEILKAYAKDEEGSIGMMFHPSSNYGGR